MAKTYISRFVIAGVIVSVLTQELKNTTCVNTTLSYELGSLESATGLNLNVFGTPLQLSVGFLAKFHQCICSERNRECSTTYFSNLLECPINETNKEYQNIYFCTWNPYFKCERFSRRGNTAKCVVNNPYSSSFIAVGKECQLKQVEVIIQNELNIQIDSFNHGVDENFTCLSLCPELTEGEKSPDLLNEKEMASVTVSVVAVIAFLVGLGVYCCKRHHKCCFKIQAIIIAPGADNTSQLSNASEMERHIYDDINPGHRVDEAQYHRPLPNEVVEHDYLELIDDPPTYLAPLPPNSTLQSVNDNNHEMESLNDDDTTHQSRNINNTTLHNMNDNDHELESVNDDDTTHQSRNINDTTLHNMNDNDHELESANDDDTTHQTRNINGTTLHNMNDNDTAPQLVDDDGSLRPVDHIRVHSVRL